MTTKKTEASEISPALVNFDSLPDSAFVRLPIVRAIFGGRSSASIYRDVLAGRLPAPVALGPRCAGWSVGELRKARAKTVSNDSGAIERQAQAVKAARAGAAKRKATAAELAGQA